MYYSLSIKDDSTTYALDIFFGLTSYSNQIYVQVQVQKCEHILPSTVEILLRFRIESPADLFFRPEIWPRLGSIFFEFFFLPSFNFHLSSLTHSKLLLYPSAMQHSDGRVSLYPLLLSSAFHCFSSETCMSESYD